MGRVDVTIPDELEAEVRKVVPNKKGALSEMATEAFRLFLKERKKHVK